MNQELVNKAIGAAATSVAQANDNADAAEASKRLGALAIRLSANAGDNEQKLLTGGLLALLNMVGLLLEENNNLLRAVVAHTGAALPSSDDRVDIFEQMFAAHPNGDIDVPEDIQPLEDFVF